MKVLQTFMNRLHDNDDNDSFNNNNNVNNKNDNLKYDDVKYFDFDYEINESNIFVINVERHVFYIDVYIFVDKFKKLIVRRNNDRVQKVIIVYLRNLTLI